LTKDKKAKDQRANLLGPSRQNHIAGGARDPGAIPSNRRQGLRTGLLNGDAALSIL
jgi:hypothetical protein